MVVKKLHESLKGGLKLRLRILGTVILFGVISIVAIAVHGAKNSRHFFSTKITSSVNFPLYYPARLPTGYKYEPGMTQLSSGILFFDIKNGPRIINIAEQKLPNQPPDLATLKKINASFKDLNLDSGNGISGIDSASRSPTVIIETNTTLISIQATLNTPSDVVVGLAKQMRSL